MSVDRYDGTEPDPSCRCRPVHGNADTDGICSHCRPRIEAAQDAREKAVHEALERFMAAIEGLPHERQRNVLESLVEAVTDDRRANQPDTCLLCGWTDGCQPGCAVDALGELI